LQKNNKKFKRIRTKLKKITKHKHGLNGETENQWNFYKGAKEQKLKIKRINIKLKNRIYDKLDLKD
jgi:hypothetical protein